VAEAIVQSGRVYRVADSTVQNTRVSSAKWQSV